MTWTFETLVTFDDELSGPAWDGTGLLFCRPGKSEIRRYDPATALIVVDVQNDFADPAGSLSVREGHLIVPVVNAEIS